MREPLKIIKLLQLSQSSNDFEALAAIRKANELVRSDSSWEQFFKLPKQDNNRFDYREIVESYRSELEGLRKLMTSNLRQIDNLKKENLQLRASLNEIGRQKVNGPIGPTPRTESLTPQHLEWIQQWQLLTPEEQIKTIDLACSVAKEPYDRVCKGIRDTFKKTGRMSDKQIICIMRAIEFNKYKESSVG